MMAADFWQNLQFDLVLVAALVVIGWALLRPEASATAACRMSAAASSWCCSRSRRCWR